MKAYLGGVGDGLAALEVKTVLLKWLKCMFQLLIAFVVGLRVPPEPESLLVSESLSMSNSLSGEGSLPIGASRTEVEGEAMMKNRAGGMGEVNFSRPRPSALRCVLSAANSCRLGGLTGTRVIMEDTDNYIYTAQTAADMAYTKPTM